MSNAKGPRGARAGKEAMDDSWLNLIVDLAREHKVIGIVYRKPGEMGSTDRRCEPYRLQESGGNLMVLCWQLNPEIPDIAKWRNFRLDRIESITDSGATFDPRCEVTICEGEVHAFQWGHEPARTLGPPVRYARLIESLMLDNRLTAAEMEQAIALQVDISRDELRGIHAQVFTNVLQEVLKDCAVSDDEEEYLAKVRRMLKKLGWAP